MNALGQRALRKSRNVAAALSEVGGLFGFENVRVRRRDHAKSAQKFHERIAKFPEFWRATRTEFVHLGQHALRKPYDVTEALNQVKCAFIFEKAGARHRDHDWHAEHPHLSLGPPGSRCWSHLVHAGVH